MDNKQIKLNELHKQIENSKSLHDCFFYQRVIKPCKYCPNNSPEYKAAVFSDSKPHIYFYILCGNVECDFKTSDHKYLPDAIDEWNEINETPEAITPQVNNNHADNINHPAHYNEHPAHCTCSRRIECIDITRHMSFNLGNVFKYVWRADLKNGIEDLEKAAWYLADEIKRRKKC